MVAEFTLNTYINFPKDVSREDYILDKKSTIYQMEGGISENIVKNIIKKYYLKGKPAVHSQAYGCREYITRDYKIFAEAALFAERFSLDNLDWVQPVTSYSRRTELYSYKQVVFEICFNQVELTEKAQNVFSKLWTTFLTSNKEVPIEIFSNKMVITGPINRQLISTALWMVRHYARRFDTWGMKTATVELWNEEFKRQSRLSQPYMSAALGYFLVEYLPKSRSYGNLGMSTTGAHSKNGVGNSANGPENYIRGLWKDSLTESSITFTAIKGYEKSDSIVAKRLKKEFLQYSPRFKIFEKQAELLEKVATSVTIGELSLAIANIQKEVVKL